MPDRVVYAVAGVWVASLLALLTLGRSISDYGVFILFGLMMTSAAFVVANCHGVLGLLRLVALAFVASVGVAVVAHRLFGDTGDTITGVLAPLTAGLLIAVVERRKLRCWPR